MTPGGSDGSVPAVAEPSSATGRWLAAGRLAGYAGPRTLVRGAVELVHDRRGKRASRCWLAGALRPSAQCPGVQLCCCPQGTAQLCGLRRRGCCAVDAVDVGGIQAMVG